MINWSEMALEEEAGTNDEASGNKFGRSVAGWEQQVRLAGPDTAQLLRELLKRPTDDSIIKTSKLSKWVHATDGTCLWVSSNNPNNPTNLNNP